MVSLSKQCPGPLTQCDHTTYLFLHVILQGGGDSTHVPGDEGST